MTTPIKDADVGSERRQPASVAGSPAPGYCAREFAEACLQEDALDGWRQTYSQLGHGRFWGRVEVLELDGLVVRRERANLGLERRSTAPGGTLTLAWIATPATGLRVDGASLSNGTLCLWLGDNDITIVTPGPSDMVTVTVPASLLPGDDVAAPGVTALAPGEKSRETVGWLSSLLSAAGDSEGSAELDVTALADLIAVRLTAVMRHGPSATAAHHHQLPRAFVRARQLFDDYRDELIDAADLPQRVACSPAALRRSFEETVGMSPGTWLRLHRLNEAHRALLHAGETGRTVSDVAMEWGFWHLGRFSDYHRRLFGTLPSAALRDRHANH